MKWKKFGSVLMALVIIFSLTVPGIQAADAMDKNGQAVYGNIINLPATGEQNTSNWGYPTQHWANGWSKAGETGTSGDKVTFIHTLMSSPSSPNNGQACYCIEPGEDLRPNASNPSQTRLYTWTDVAPKADWDFWYYAYNPATNGGKLSGQQVENLICRLLTYGYTGPVSVYKSNGTLDHYWRTQTEKDQMAKYLATQILIWEVIVGERDANFNHIAPPANCSPVKDVLNSKNVLRTGTDKGGKSYFDYYYDLLVYQVRKHDDVPSFTSPNLTSSTQYMSWDQSKGLYTITLTDQNNTLSRWNSTGTITPLNATAANNVKFTVDPQKNTLTITAKSLPAEGLNILFTTENRPVTSVSVYSDRKYDSSRGQDFKYYGFGPAKYYGSGQTDIQDLIGPGTTKSNYFSAYIKLKGDGSLELVKTSEDGVVAGLRFNVTGPNFSKTVTTDSTGKFRINNLTPGKYTVEEVLDSSSVYVKPASQTVTVQGGQTASVTFHNALKNFRVQVTKRDSEAGGAQGGGSLAGAVYGLYCDGNEIARCVTDASGKFTTDYYKCSGTQKWTVREIAPSPGYLLDPTEYTVDASPGSYTQLNNTVALTVTETVIKGRISILKTAGGNGATGIQQPEDGAAFQIYLKSAGSYEAAKEAERDILTCDANGFAKSKSLPYGTYVVHQTGGWQETVYAPDFEVQITRNEQTLHYTINNAWKTVRVKAVKVDSTTGCRIPVAGVGFQFYDSDGQLLTWESVYPTPATVDTFYTGADGTLTTPFELRYGSYTAVEVSAPEGYVLDPTPRAFTVSDSTITTENDLSYVLLEVPNVPQMGRITITKTGEGFASVTQRDGLYIPVYSSVSLSGAVFEVRAAEDIVTPDGTLRCAKNTVVDTVTTGADGTAVTKDLYLGRYTVTEIQAPEGYVLDSTPREAVLAYAGQEVSAASQQVGIKDARQKAEISLVKALETDETFQIGQNGEMKNVTFGLYAAGEISAIDGTVIPADGLVATGACAPDGSLVFDADLPLGSYYVRETATDGHYLLSDAKYPVEFRDDSGTALAEIAVNNGQPIPNKLIYGRIHGYKLGEDSEPLSGAVFGLFPAGTTKYTTETAILTAASNESGEFSFEDVPYGKYEIKELTAPKGHVLDDTVYVVEISYHSQSIGINVPNEKIRGSVQTTKVDLEFPDHKLSGAVFAVYADANADGKLDEDELASRQAVPEISKGVYRLDGLVYGSYLLREEAAPEGYYLDENVYPFVIDAGGEIETVENQAGVGFLNQHIPEIATQATADGKKDVYAAEMVTLTDTVAYEHLIPGKTYTVKGILMDKSTGEPFLVNGGEVRAETEFVPEAPSGTVDVEFTFDASGITEKTEIVVFEGLYEDGVELAVHADIDDEGQTVTIHVPEIGTQASIGGKKEVTASGPVTIQDTVSYKGLIPGEEHTVKGILMNKSTGEPLLAEGKEIRAEAVFTPEQADGEVTVTFTVDAKYLTRDTDLVVFESLYRESTEIAVHADIDDKGQTVTIRPAKPGIPQTGDTGALPLWALLLTASLTAAAALAFLAKKPGRSKKN